MIFKATCYLKLSALLLKVLISFVVLCSTAKAGDWYLYESENFRIVADKKRKHANQELTDLELFRQATLVFTGIEHVDEKSRLTILILEKSKNYLDIFPEKRAAGFYIDSYNGPYMVVGPSDSPENSAITLRHEYVHHLLHSASSVVYPKWYDEGLSDVLSTAKIGKNSVAIGAPYPWRSQVVKLAQLLSFNDLITPSNALREGNYGQLYYSSAWLAVHYFVLGTINGEDLGTANLKRYLAAFNSGRTSPFEFESLIGRDIAGLNRDLKRYAQKPEYFGFRLPVPGYTGPVSTSRLSTNEQYIELAGVAIARKQWQKISKLTNNPKQDAKADTLIAMGYLASLEENADNIDRKKLLQLKLTTPIGQALAAAAMTRKAQQTDDVELFEKAKALAQESIKEIPHNLYAREVLWREALRVGNPQEAIAQLEIAHGYFPANLNIALELAELYAAEGKLEKAKPIAHKVSLWTHDQDMAEAARKLLAKLEASSQ